jgi:hypothetical protein
VLLSVFAKNLCKQGRVAGSKKICFRLLRATSVFAFGLPKANASVEFAYLRKKHWRRQRRQFLRAPRVPRGNPLARFLGSFFAAWQRMNIKTTNRSARRDIFGKNFAEQNSSGAGKPNSPISTKQNYPRERP